MYIGYFCGAEGAAKFFLPPIDGGHCPPSNFRRGALPPINFEILGIAAIKNLNCASLGAPKFCVLLIHRIFGMFENISKYQIFRGAFGAGTDNSNF